MSIVAKEPGKFRSAKDIGVLWQQRHLIFRLTRRDIEVRVRGSLLGTLWVAILPIYMLSLYTFAFTIVFHARWPGPQGRGTLHVALLYFAGLIFNDMLAEGLNRAPALMFENVSYIKRVIFPIEILACVAAGSALFRLCIGALILLLFYVALEGVPPLTAVVLPVLLAPTLLMMLGLMWIMSAVGVYIRDLRQAAAVVTPALMFTSPTFFPLSAVPEPFRELLYINPLTFLILSVRGSLFFRMWPNWFWLGVYTMLAGLFAAFGYFCFMRLRDGFADVM